MSRLLVSVRSAEEAAAALEGGALLIDVKEPRFGSLGRASDRTIDEVVAFVSGRVPVSAAMGEFEESLPLPAAHLGYVKWGLAGAGSHSRWQDRLGKASHALKESGTHVVAVAYADWQRAHAPEPAAVLDWACAANAGAFMLDTWSKDGTNLLHWLTVADVERLADRCRTAKLPLALAGSLGRSEIASLSRLRPDWFAVRGAVCVGGRRDAQVSAALVHALADEALC
jgi:uncharacterized protein (UPF0264 family)